MMGSSHKPEKHILLPNLNLSPKTKKPQHRDAAVFKNRKVNLYH